MRRRTFLAGMGAAAVARAAEASGMRFGYTAMTWGTAERQAVDDIAAAGYEGIQFRIDATTEFQPDEVRTLLDRQHLTFVALSSGEVSIDAPAEGAGLSKHVANAGFVHDAGGLYLQVLDQLKPYRRTVTLPECRQLGKLLTELGKQTADLGVPLVYHNHMNTIGEHPAQLDALLEASDARYVHLLLDTAHSVAGGGDPAAAVLKYRDRLQLVHLKDVVDIPLNTPKAKYPFQFVELGRGRVNFPAVFAALRKIDYRGWAVVELDRVPDQSRTPLESARISRKYLQDSKL